MQEELNDKEKLIEYYLELKERAKDSILGTFLPEKPEAKPFAEQLLFFRDPALTRLLRCGNRAGKTCSTMRDLAWKITRTHPYRKKWNHEYKKSKPKVFWIVGPSYDFVNSTMWGMYLKEFIPDWFYTDDDGKEMISYTNQRNIDKITFRNGDTIECMSYAQSDLAVMGRAIDDLTIDEMPRTLKLLSELITRCLDRDGEVTMGFTPIVENEDIKDYLDKSKNVSAHSWSLLANPHYRDNPERLKRALSEWENLPEQERMTRLKGDWYYERKFGRVFEGCEFEEIEDFEVPHSWRRARIADPAAHVTGFSEWAENPETGQWVCINAVEFKWKSKLATDTMILTEIEKYKPYPGFRYTLSLYDNAEAWFGSNGAKHGFIPCIQKNRAVAIMDTRKAVKDKKVAVFKHKGALLVKQFDNYHFKDDGNVNKRNDHVLDTCMYFIRQIPPREQVSRRDLTEKDYIKASYFDQLEKKSKEPEPTKMQTLQRRFIRRTAR